MECDYDINGDQYYLFSVQHAAHSRYPAPAATCASQYSSRPRLVPSFPDVNTTRCSM